MGERKGDNGSVIDMVDMQGGSEREESKKNTI